MKDTGGAAEYSAIGMLMHLGGKYGFWVSKPTSSMTPHTDILLHSAYRNHVRVQVKGANLESPPAVVQNLAQDYDFLVIVAYEDDDCLIFVLSREEVEIELRRGVLTSLMRTGEIGYDIKTELLPYINKWRKVTEAMSAPRMAA